MDDWTSNFMQNVGILFSYPAKDYTTLLTEHALDSDRHIKLIQYILDLYGKILSNVVLIGDNGELNKCISNDT